MWMAFNGWTVYDSHCHLMIAVTVPNEWTQPHVTVSVSYLQDWCPHSQQWDQELAAGGVLSVHALLLSPLRPCTENKSISRGRTLVHVFSITCSATYPCRLLTLNIQDLPSLNSNKRHMLPKNTEKLNTSASYYKLTTEHLCIDL